MACVFVLTACSGDDSSSETPPLINTSWTRINTDDAGLSFRVKMDFYSDHYDFLLLQAAEGHTDSTAIIHVVSDLFYILEDADCEPPQGQYAWRIENDVLNLTRITDVCDGRITAIEGPWNRVLIDEDVRFRVRLDFYEQTFDFVLLEEAPGHDDSSGLLEVIGHEFILSGDVDCNGATGRYIWKIIGDTLEIDVIEDPCVPRAAALIGQWDLFLPLS